MLQCSSQIFFVHRTIFALTAECALQDALPLGLGKPFAAKGSEASDAPECLSYGLYASIRASGVYLGERRRA
jgi:hypothetical protein